MSSLNVTLIGFCEFYYRAVGQDVGFDPMFPVTDDDTLGPQFRNLVQLQTLSNMDCSISTIAWQRQSYPTIFHDKIEVVHDGIDTRVVKPDEATVFILPNGRHLTRKDEVVTFVNRNLEPCRGFVSLMRAARSVTNPTRCAYIDCRWR